ncbi:hypothetical protein GCM10009548_36210 [Streptomyces malaysiensis subsp. malaysiensis]|nr:MULTISPECIES: DUF4190 domain-containing protein [Streptomyces]UHH20484.1 hypothetical protein LUV23_31890 [Streptomyces sp. HNM0561]
MADQHEPSEPQDVTRRPGQPRQPEPLDRDPWAPPAQRVSMEKVENSRTGNGSADQGAAPEHATDKAMDKVTGRAVSQVVGEPEIPAPRHPVAEQPTLTSHPAMPGPTLPPPPPPPPSAARPRGPVTPPGAVPPPPPAPTGPGTPSAYQAGPYSPAGYAPGYAPTGYASAGYAQTGYAAQTGYGQPTPYGQPAPYGGAPGHPGYGYPATAYPGTGYPGSGYPGTGYPGTGYPGGTYGQGWPGGTYVPNNGHGTAALVLGIIGLVLFASIVLGIVLGVLAIIFGVLGRARAKSGEATNGGSALAGVILGAVAVVVSVVMIFVYIATGDDGSDGDDDPGYAHVSAAKVLSPADIGR